MIALRSTPRTRLPATATPLNLSFGSDLRLAGWEPVETDYPLPAGAAGRLPGPNWQIALYWQATAPLAEDYTISVRPLVGGN